MCITHVESSESSSYKPSSALLVWHLCTYITQSQWKSYSKSATIMGTLSMFSSPGICEIIFLPFLCQGAGIKLKALPTLSHPASGDHFKCQLRAGAKAYNKGGILNESYSFIHSLASPLPPSISLENICYYSRSSKPFPPFFNFLFFL